MYYGYAIFIMAILIISWSSYVCHGHIITYGHNECTTGWWEVGVGGELEVTETRIANILFVGKQAVIDHNKIRRRTDDCFDLGRSRVFCAASNSCFQFIQHLVEKQRHSQARNNLSILFNHRGPTDMYKDRRTWMNNIEHACNMISFSSQLQVLALSTNTQTWKQRIRIA